MHRIAIRCPYSLEAPPPYLHAPNGTYRCTHQTPFYYHKSLLNHLTSTAHGLDQVPANVLLQQALYHEVKNSFGNSAVPKAGTISVDVANREIIFDFNSLKRQRPLKQPKYVLADEVTSTPVSEATVPVTATATRLSDSAERKDAAGLDRL
eukprot:TRINITY_DN1647_c0_g1_i10.p2 TRINITY_DN1647_c0_g1~~TRINITY_DN1647_c0_g1_i10.p2  ORF type:complete len:151 (-),score=8.75 TRINITY_DN1647_c0_g1_i10:1029-1481(-)